MPISYLPAYSIREDHGGNSIVRLVEKERIVNNIGFDGEVLSCTDKDSNIIYITQSSKIKEEYKYALVSNAVPTLDAFMENRLELKWVKHPSEDPGQIIESWKDKFCFREEDLSNSIIGLRNPQIGAIYAALAHFKVSDETGIIVMPTGTGKTETMISLMILNRPSKLLITVPTDALRNQLADKFITLGLLPTLGVVDETVKHPAVGIIYKQFLDPEELIAFLERCNVIITTMSLIAGCDNIIQNTFKERCTYYFVDEAHHDQAATWASFINLFTPSKVLKFTATPYRNDGQRLGGKIIFNYPLRKAQEERYFTRINFKSVWEYSTEKADKEIAQLAVSILREDLAAGYNHIVMARCVSRKRADSVFNNYKKYTEFNPVKIYSGTGMTDRDRAEAIDKIKTFQSRIVVCVDMLGEGFDLPELKIAAFHDVKKSLPTTLQLAGRFTRTKQDNTLGEATFIANIADSDVSQKLEDLYANDPDWNVLLRRLSNSLIENEIRTTEFFQGFGNSNPDLISWQNIKFALSAVIYQTNNETWTPMQFMKALKLSEKDKLIFDYNHQQNVLVIVHGEILDVDWGNIKNIQNTSWKLIIAYFDLESRLLFIHSSDNSSLYGDFARSVVGSDATLIRGMAVFKAFHNINRVVLQNIGLKEFLSKSIKFRMSTGGDVGSALSLAEKQRATKAFVYGVGYENGEKTTLGCSYKGRIWMRMTGNIRVFINWCNSIASKLLNPDIDPNAILTETLIPNYVTEVPQKMAFWIDWNEQIYTNSETNVVFYFDNFKQEFYTLDLEVDYDAQPGKLVYSLIDDDDVKAKFELVLFKNDNEVEDFSIKILESKYESITVKYGNKSYTVKDFFEKYEPTIWFADGSSLSGNEYIELKQTIHEYPRDRVVKWDWAGVNISRESREVSPIITNSIQQNVIERLLETDVDVIYDDDGKGEIADIITIKDTPHELQIDLYHLKYAKGGVVSQQIANLYEVCGQAQKCIKWKSKESKELIEHLLRRKTKRKNRESCSRICKGNEEKLKELLMMAKRKVPVEFRVFIIQPGFCPDIATGEQLTLLSVTENYLKEVAGIDVIIIGNDNKQRGAMGG